MVASTDRFHPSHKFEGADSSQEDQNALIAGVDHLSIHTLQQVRVFLTYTSYSNDMGIPGAFVSPMLYGLMTLQTYLYLMHYSEDASTMKFLVFAIWILDTLHVSFICHVLYYYLITNYGVLTSLEYPVWSLSASLVVNAVVVAVAQCFFARRIYYLCRPQVRWLVTAPIILFTIILFGLGFEIAVLIFVNNEFSALLSIKSYATIPFVVIRVLDEVLITLSLCILLYGKGSRSAFPRTKRLMNMLVIYAINRCFLTLLFALAECVTLHRWKPIYMGGGVRIQHWKISVFNIAEYPAIPPSPGFWFWARSSHQRYPLQELPEAFG